MAYAYGFGHGMGMGFGLGFLNFIGTILFIVAVFWTLKFIARGFRGYASDRYRGSGEYGDGGRGDGGGGGDDGSGNRFGWGGWGGWCGPVRHGRGEHRRSDHGHSSYASGRHRRDAGRHRPDAAELVARERLARGQITTEEYEKLRAGLESGGDGNDGGADGRAADGSAADLRVQRRRRWDRATEVARLRFASGEVSQDEFNAIRPALDS